LIYHFFPALLPVLAAALAQNAEFHEHLKAFQGAGLLVKALLDAAAREPKKKEVYMEEVQEESEVLALRALVLPRPVPSSAAVAKLEVSLALFGEGGETGISSRHICLLFVFVVFFNSFLVIHSYEIVCDCIYVAVLAGPGFLG